MTDSSETTAEHQILRTTHKTMLTGKCYFMISQGTTTGEPIPQTNRAHILVRQQQPQGHVLI